MVVGLRVPVPLGRSIDCSRAKRLSSKLAEMLGNLEHRLAVAFRLRTRRPAGENGQVRISRSRSSLRPVLFANGKTRVGGCAYVRMIFTKMCLNGDRPGQGRDRSGVQVGNAPVGSKRAGGGRLTFVPPCRKRSGVRPRSLAASSSCMDSSGCVPTREQWDSLAVPLRSDPSPSRRVPLAAGGVTKEGGGGK